MAAQKCSEWCLGCSDLLTFKGRWLLNGMTMQYSHSHSQCSRRKSLPTILNTEPVREVNKRRKCGSENEKDFKNYGAKRSKNKLQTS